MAPALQAELATYLQSIHILAWGSSYPQSFRQSEKESTKADKATDKGPANTCKEAGDRRGTHPDHHDCKLTHHNC